VDHRHEFYTFERFSVGNLEALVFAPGAAGPSGLLLDVIVPEGGGGESHNDNDILNIEVPLLARCGVPRRDGELLDEVVLPPLEAFWACGEEHGDGDGDGRGAGQSFVAGSELTYMLYIHKTSACT
jgi:hypothetical protein